MHVPMLPMSYLPNILSLMLQKNFALAQVLL